MTGRRVVVVGAGSALGFEIARIASACGHEVTATYRTQRNDVEKAIGQTGAEPARLDVEDKNAVMTLLSDKDAVVFTPILTTSAAAAEILVPEQRAVFFSSNNVAIDPGAAVYARLLDAEGAVRAAAPQAAILRPTMIYGYPGDGNLSSLMTAMRRFPVTPMPGKESALQQPVFYRDLARVAVDVLFDESLAGQTRAVAGPKPIAKRALYRAAAKAAGRSPLIAPVPSWPAAGVLEALERAGLKFPVSSAQLRRADMDKIPQGERPILTGTSLEQGLSQLAALNFS